MSTFSEVLQASGERLESLAAMPEPVRSLESIFEAAERNPGLDVEDAASLIAWAREPGRRAEIHAAAQRVRAEGGPAHGGVCHSGLSHQLLPERVPLLRLSPEQRGGRARAADPGRIQP